jgi:hypothetical protein
MTAKIKRINVASTSDFLTAEEAGIFLDIQPLVVRNYLAEGKLTTYKFKTLTLVNKAEVVEWKSTRSRR